MKKICIFTGTRAEYGLLKPLMKQILQDETCDLQIMVTGMHLSSEFGQTYQLIEKDGFIINEKIEILLSSDTPVGINKSMGLGLISFSEAFDRLRPDWLILLGDRFETFAAATAATVHNLPIAHIHGGETTLGAWDDAFRHSITKMSYLHFTSADVYRRRVIQLGENPDRVFSVGALGVEALLNTELLSKEKLYQDMGFGLDVPFLLITFHPVTLEGGKTIKDFRSLLIALEDSSLEKYHLVFTKANADSFGRQINQMTDEFVSKNEHRAIGFDSMGQVRYLTAMKYASAVVGNSSSGILEAPSFNTPVINIGIRQTGRVKSANIVDCSTQTEAVLAALKKGVSSAFQTHIKGNKNPFEKLGTAQNILKTITDFDLSALDYKEFYDNK